MNQNVGDPKWWKYLARFLLGLTVIIVCVYIYNTAALKTFGRYDGIGHSIGYGIFSMFSLAVLFGASLLAAIGVITGFLLKYSLKLYVTMFVTSLAVILICENYF